MQKFQPILLKVALVTEKLQKKSFFSHKRQHGVTHGDPSHSVSVHMENS